MALLPDSKKAMTYRDYLWAVPVVVYLGVSILGPLFSGREYIGQYLDYLYRVVDVERRAAPYTAPGFRYGDWEILSEGWAFHTARRAVIATLPGAEEGLAITGSEREMYAQGATEPYDGDPEAITRKMGSWVEDRFWPVQAVYLVSVVTRALQALALFLALLPLFVMAFKYGLYRVAIRDLTGQKALNHRFVIYMHILHFLLIAAAVIIVAPVPIPGIVVLAPVLLLLVWTVALARANAVSQL